MHETRALFDQPSITLCVCMCARVCVLFAVATSMRVRPKLRAVDEGINPKAKCHGWVVSGDRGTGKPQKATCQSRSSSLSHAAAAVTRLRFPFVFSVDIAKKFLWHSFTPFFDIPAVRFTEF